MSFSLALGDVTAFVLVSLRLAMTLFATPMDAFGKVPTRVRVMWILGLACWISLATTANANNVPTTLIDLTTAVFAELLLGAVLAFGLYTSFGAFLLAGRLIDFQAGFGAANLFDPTTNEQNPLFGTLLMMLAAVIFFTADLHHVLLKGFAYSFELHPVGSQLLELDLADVTRQFGLMFNMGIMLAGPIIGILLLVDAGVAIMSRSMPQMNVYFLFLPLKALLCFIALAWLLPIMSPLLLRTMDSSFTYWQRVL